MTLNFGYVSVFRYEIFTVIVIMLAPWGGILHLLSLFLFLQVCVLLKSTGKAEGDLKDRSHLFVKWMEHMGSDKCNSGTWVMGSTAACVVC